VSENKLQKRLPSVITEKSQYFLVFGVIATMLYVVEFPIFVIFFFGIFAYFLMKMFAAGSRNETREIFEFYLSANEMLRDDERRWYGFEINETIQKGENILQKMSAAPPLVYFTLGALYNKAGDHSSAVNNLAHVIENESSGESSYAFPSPELRSYVKVLRKIEREPADAPLTSAAVRALERARKIRGKALLDESRAKLAAAENGQTAAQLGSAETHSTEHGKETFLASMFDSTESARTNNPSENTGERHRSNSSRKNSRRQPKNDPFVDRKPITEVLHDIYDKNIQ
jgi:hypothetical protein